MRSQLFIAACLAAVSADFSQAFAQTNTFPNAYEKYGTSGAISLPFFWDSARTQLIVSEARKRVIVREVAFRRGTFAMTGTSRAITLTVRVGEGDYASPSTTFAQNWSSPPTVALDKKSVNLPNWSQPTKLFPAPFDFVVKLDRLYVHVGTKDLVIDFAVTSSAKGGGMVSSVFYRKNSNNYGSSEMISTGCNSANGQQGTQLLARSLMNGGDSELFLSIYRAPSNAPAIFLLGFQNPDVQIPGLCAKLLTSADIPLSLGVTDSRGSVRVTPKLGAYKDAFAGNVIYGQSLVFDTSRTVPFSLGNGVRCQLPLTKEPAPAMKQLVAFSSTATGVNSVREGGFVFQVR